MAEAKVKTAVIQPLPGIGDMIWHLPALQAIAAQAVNKKIDLFFHEKVPVKLLLVEETSINQFYTMPMGRTAGARAKTIRWLIKTLKAGGYKQVIILHHSLRYALAARLAGIKDVKGYGFGLQKLFLTRQVPLPAKARKIFPLLRLHKFLDNIGIAGYAVPTCLNVNSDRVKQVNELYEDMPKPWVGIAIGASEKIRQWPPERFAIIADLLWQKTIIRSSF